MSSAFAGLGSRCRLQVFPLDCAVVSALLASRNKRDIHCFVTAVMWKDASTLSVSKFTGSRKRNRHRILTVGRSRDRDCSRPPSDPDERSLAHPVLISDGWRQSGHPERDEACSVEETSAEPRQEYASTRSGVSGSGGGEYATIAQAPGHGTPPGSRVLSSHGPAAHP